MPVLGSAKSTGALTKHPHDLRELVSVPSEEPFWHEKANNTHKGVHDPEDRYIAASHAIFLQLPWWPEVPTNTDSVAPGRQTPVLQDPVRVSNGVDLKID